MRKLQNKFKRQHKPSRLDHEENPCRGVDNISIIVHKKKVKNRKLYDLFKNGKQPAIAFRLSRSGLHKTRKRLTKHLSLPEINKKSKISKHHTKSSDAILKKKNCFNTKIIVNRVSGYNLNEYLSPFNFPTQRRWKVYRCQLSSQEDSCCCSCNSDAMFEVMKSLYDCYKKKNCDNCNCILCGHLPQEERRLGEIKKSIASLGLDAKERKETIKKSEKALRGKSKEEKEKILKELAKTGKPLPEGKTASEKSLIQKVRADLGLPPAPKTASEKAKMRKAEQAGAITPLEGKTPSQKEKILKAQAQLGIPLPEGRTESEKALIQKVKAAAGIPMPEERTLSEKAVSAKLKAKPSEAKAAGLSTPLEGKTPSQKEKILKGLAKQGIPLPEGKTASEKKLIDKVRADLDLPPEPKTPSMREKYIKAADAGLLQPLEGKTHKEKEKIIQGLQEMGIPLPEGRTATEKALVARAKAVPRPPSVLAPSEKLRKAKAAGLLTPLAGKPPAQREKILRGLAMQNVPLPEGKTPSEKMLIDKVRRDLGLPPEPKTPSMKEKHAKAAKAGFLQPLEGKTPKEKEKILQGLHDMGIPLPEGRTASEKDLIAKIKALPRAPSMQAPVVGPTALSPEERRKLDEKTAKVVKEGKGPADECICGLLTPEHEREPAIAIRIPSAKMRPTKAGLLTPLEGKTPEQKEKILRGLIKQGIPLPEAKTPSEKKLVNKIRADVRLPPEPRTPSMKEKYRKAQASGVITPLEGKTTAQKDKILKRQAELGLELPKGQTPSEKAIISKLKTLPSPSITSEKLRKAKAAGLLTPLEGKSPAQKENILRGLAKSGLPLPEGRTPSDKAMIKKIKKEMGVPERTPSEKLRKAKAAGLLTPLEGKPKSQKEKILRGRAAAGLPLPAGKTPSEKDLIKKIKDDTGYVTPSPSERMKKAKAAGLLTPLEGKTPSAKEKILRGKAAVGVPLGEGKTPSEKEIIKKIKAELPELKPSSEKLRAAKAAGLSTPLQGKTPSQKEKIIRGLAKSGLPLPEGKTPSEKELIAKAKAETKPPSQITSEKFRKAKAAGLLTPLTGKSPKEKERILKGLANQGLPLPEAKTVSEKKIAAKVRKELGLPPEPETVSDKEKMRKAQAAGIVTPLRGKTPSQKQRIVRGMADAGVKLPEGRTASEKALISKVKAEPTKVPSEKLPQAKAAGLLTPLEGKTDAQKEKTLRKLAEAGLPLPEGKTPSEKSLIQKIKSELPKTASEKSVVRKAKAEGLLTPLTGKTPKEKERILRGLAEAGLPLPEGKTASEKELVKKVKDTAPGVPPQPKSEKRKKSKSKKIGVTPSKKLAKTMAKATPGITQEFEDIIKTTTCDRGCGCDKKKIRFKHSYVKIKVTSPDISSLCPCPDECIPGVKAGAFIDNEGIKVTVGRVDGAISYTNQHKNNYIVTLFDRTLKNRCCSTTSSDTIDAITKGAPSTVETDILKRSLYETCPSLRYTNYNDKFYSDNETVTECNSQQICSNSCKSNENDTNDRYDDTKDTQQCEKCTASDVSAVESSCAYTSYATSEASQNCGCESSSNESIATRSSVSASFNSALVIKSESSLSLGTNPNTNSCTTSISTEAASAISLSHSSNNSATSASPVCPFCMESEGRNSSDTSEDETESFANEIDCSGTDDSSNDTETGNSSESVEPFDGSQLMNKEPGIILGLGHRHACLNYRLSQALHRTEDKMNRNKKNINSHEPVIVINNLNSERDITAIVDRLLSNNEFSDASSIILVVPTSDDNDSDRSAHSLRSPLCIQLSEHCGNYYRKHCSRQEPEIKHGRDVRRVRVSAQGKKYCLQGMAPASAPAAVSFHDKETMINCKGPFCPAHKRKHALIYKNKLCQITTPDGIWQKVYHAVSTDTTADRPCCCPRKDLVKHQKRNCKHRCVSSVIRSEVISPLLVNKGLSCEGQQLLPNPNVTQQVSFASVNQGPKSVAPCEILPCSGRFECHTPRDSSVINRHSRASIKPCPSVKQNSRKKQSRPCQCNPEQLKKLIEEALQVGKALKLISTGCGGSAGNVTEKDVKIGFCTPPREDTTKQCTCSGKKKKVKLRPLCPCEQFQPPISQTVPGPKDGTTSLGCQCCNCDDSSLKSEPQMGTITVVGPGGGLSKIESKGTFTQAGMVQEQNEKPRKECVCKNKKGKKKQNVNCECPSEPEPELDLDLLCQEYANYLWLHDQMVSKQKSDMTQTQSGFTMFKKKKPPEPPEAELTMDDAVRYYVSMNPALFKDLVLPLQNNEDCSCEEDKKGKNKKKKSKKVDCSCSYEPPEPPPPPEPAPPEGPSGGLKFSMFGKGSGSKGLTGVCCFDLIEERKDTKQGTWISKPNTNE
ncbi:uncharacterized protein LOC110379260 isoform X1 [Helicoverpa armigera]|uniref:uncharacterized protein LOC110379260 isoform X1 n=1 Tax=Helicoverpa armigera TaxID=29058 RepID=UPI0030830E79